MSLEFINGNANAVRDIKKINNGRLKNGTDMIREE